MAGYHKEVENNNTLLLRERLAHLPKFLASFFRAIEPTTSSRTRIAYAYDLSIFFDYLKSENPTYRNRDIRDINEADLDKITAVDIEEYMEYLKLYEKDGRTVQNAATGRSRKLAALRTMYNYYYRKEFIKNNPAALVPMPKLHEKNIIRLDGEEILKFIDAVENGTGLTERQRVYHKKTRVRDLALITLLLGTGIRVSECVGLNLDDVDLAEDAIKITRKGGDEARVYFSDEVHLYMADYFEERKAVLAARGSENAFFLSSQRSRITVRAVENLVKKYAKAATPLKKITPHKLRSTYGTNLYRQTGDIYLVADVLGHKDVNTTRKHYADQDERRRREAGRAFRLTDTEE
ncbi:MAG: tyrosine-type recombinase/integrase [Eubacteriales bacterium]|nr:tyrosine-type recombinase/integrase [Eubacteriales bacterium]